jgi:hypothetical protein
MLELVRSHRLKQNITSNIELLLLLLFVCYIVFSYFFVLLPGQAWGQALLFGWYGGLGGLQDQAVLPGEPGIVCANHSN